MDFESRFMDLFWDESQLPAPLQITSVKRRKSFSEKFFKSASGSTLKLSRRHALKLRHKLAFRDKSVNKEKPSPDEFKNDDENWDTVETISETNQVKVVVGDLELPMLSSFPRSLSNSVECLPISENVDAYLPVSSHSSVITFSKFNTFKAPSNKFGTFRHEQALNSSPYGRIFKGRLHRSRPELNGICFDVPDTPAPSPLPYTFPVTPLLDSSIASSVSFSESLHELKANFYGQGTDKTSFPRTDYSCRVSPLYGKNTNGSLNTLKCLDVDSQSRHCKQIQTPKVEYSFFANGIGNGLSDEPSDQAETQTNETNEIKCSSPCDTRIITEFHKELLARCSIIRTNDLNCKSLSEENSRCPDVPKEFHVEKVTNILEDKEHSFQLYYSRQSNFSKPEIFTKPNIRSKSDLALKLESVLNSESAQKARSAFVYKSGKSDLVSNSSLKSKPRISPKPDILSKVDASVKPDRPTSLKPERPTSLKPERPTSLKPERPTSLKPERPTSLKPERLTSLKPERHTSLKPERLTSLKPERTTSLKPERTSSEKPTSLKQEKPTSLKLGTFVKPSTSLKPDRPTSVIPDRFEKPDTSPRSDISFRSNASSKPNISPKADNFLKPNIPGKPECLKNMERNLANSCKLNRIKYMPEINNNCIVTKNSLIDEGGFRNELIYEHNQKYLRDKNIGYVCLNGVSSVNGSSSESDNQSEVIQNGVNHSDSDLSDCENKSIPPPLISKQDEQYDTLRVRDLVATFNKVLSVSNMDCSNSVSNKFPTVQSSTSFLKSGSRNSPKKSVSEWNLVNTPKPGKISEKYGSLCDSLNRVKIPHFVPLTGRSTTSRSKY